MAAAIIGTTVITAMMMIVADSGTDENAADDTGGSQSGSLVFSLLRLGAIGLIGRADTAIVTLRSRTEPLRLASHFGIHRRFLRCLTAR